ncbi:RNA polymerase sigma factor [Mucilaginibacter boryungensis]|uniref:RNA polymerase sigma-70 factor n=1 Tax=Mucilaginibacter boryungensis TaxID=768480 RepID=A0ABR9XN87_9SPHI|nr:RNA polymerase sigma-70 factor [Mucilaginibacter boryungensis]MBE9668761.1 RNA polymerase sigma-70 factor [Mucilaginibacter boryungensis]
MYLQTPAALEAEKELIRRLNTGDARAFEKLYQLYSVRILKKLILLVKDEDIAAELLQDIFLKLWQRREIIDAEQSLRPYLFRMAENKITDLFRRAAYDKKLLAHLVAISTELCNDTEDTLDLKDNESLLKQAIESLPPQRQKVFILCKIEGKSYDEVATLLGISAGTVNDHMVKAGRAVKKYFNSADLALLTLMVASASQIFKS